MRRIAFAVVLALLFAHSLSAADKPQVAGKWDIISADDAGNQQSWVLTVKQEQGKLSGSLDGGNNNDHFDLLDPKLTGNAFSFSIAVGDDRVDANFKVEGKKLQGSYTSDHSGSGTVTGTKQG